MRNWLTSGLAIVLLAGAVGCQSHTGNGALIGGAGGALAGAAIGSHSHSSAGAGALIGGTIGAVTGAVIGNEIDRQEHYDDSYDRDPYAAPPPAYRGDPYYAPPPPYRPVRYYRSYPPRYGYGVHFYGGRGVSYGYYGCP